MNSGGKCSIGYVCREGNKSYDDGKDNGFFQRLGEFGDHPRIWITFSVN